MPCAGALPPLRIAGTGNHVMATSMRVRVYTVTIVYEFRVQKPWVCDKGQKPEGLWRALGIDVAGPGGPPKPTAGPTGPPSSAAGPSGTPPSQSTSGPANVAVDDQSTRSGPPPATPAEPVTEVTDGSTFEDAGNGYFYRKMADGSYEQTVYIKDQSGQYIPYES